MTDEHTSDTGPRRGRRWPKVLLAASLTLNMLVLSVIAGAVFRDGSDIRDGGNHRAPPPPADGALLREGGFMPFFDAMPRDARKRMIDAFRASETGHGPDRATLAADLRAFVQALRAEPFEPDRLGAVLQAQNARVQHRITAGRNILIDQIGMMSPAERAAFADTLEHRFQRALNRAPGRSDDGRDRP